MRPTGQTTSFHPIAGGKSAQAFDANGPPAPAAPPTTEDDRFALSRRFVALPFRVMAALPTISLVTPVRNGAKYVEQTFRSVAAQEYDNLEYVVVDGASTDGTQDVIRRHEGTVTRWSSEPDCGMYDAINKGFALTTGDFMGWLSGTDMLHRGALQTVASVFESLPEVAWITGIPTFFNESGSTIHIDPLPRWSRARFLAGANQSIQQESTFWRRSLWEAAGGHVDASRRNGSDFELWLRFFRWAQLHTVVALIGGYRLHGDSLGVTGVADVRETHRRALERELRDIPYGSLLRPLHALERRATRSDLGRRLWHHVAFRPLYRIPGPDTPGMIRFRSGHWEVSPWWR